MKTTHLFLSALTSCFLTACNSSPTAHTASVADGIVRGAMVSTADDFRSHIVAVYDEGTHSLCTGTLIRQDLVLTAAHCVEGSPTANSFKIFLGLDLQDSSHRKDIQVATIIMHGSYKKDSKDVKNDIALIKMLKPAPSPYKPAALALRTDNFEDPTNQYLATGYGITGSEGKDSGTLRKLLVSGNNLASSNKGALIAINASEEGGPCHGDSGGPLFKITKTQNGEKQYAVMGVTSVVSQFIWNGVKTNDYCKGISFYTSVPTYSQWIQKNVEKL